MFAQTTYAADAVELDRIVQVGNGSDLSQATEHELDVIATACYNLWWKPLGAFCGDDISRCENAVANEKAARLRANR